MTNREVVDLAIEAAESAFDAFSGNDDGFYPPWDSAYDFVVQFRFDEFDGDDVEAEALDASLSLTEKQEVWFQFVYYASLGEMVENLGRIPSKQ